MAPIPDIESKTDEEVAVLVLEDPERYVHLMRRYEAKILRYIVRITGLASDDAEDVLQEVFIKAYRHLRDFDPTLKFSSWLYRIAHNEAVSQFRKSKARPQVVRSDEEDQDLVQKLVVDPDLQGNFDRGLDAARVKAAIDSLGGKYREVLILRFIEDRDYREISDILCKPMGTVATLINRAKAGLRDRLQDQAKP